MGQSTVILAFAATILLAVLMIAMQRSNNDSDEDLAVYHNTVLAREASMTGMNLTVRRLVDDPDNWFVNTASYEYPATNYNGASFVVTASSPHPDTVAVVSVGTHHGVAHRAEAIFAKGLISGGLNEVFNYAVVSEQDLTFNGSTDILAANGTANANVHANGDLSSSGNNVHVEGYGTFGPSGSEHVNPHNRIDQIFHPNDDSNGGGQNVHSADEIDIPMLDPSQYATAPPADIVFAGNASLFNIDRAWLTANGYSAQVGTESHPFLMYVGGDLTGSGNVVIDDIYFQAVVAGEISLSGNVTTSATAIPSKNAPQATWDAWIAANLTATGQTAIGLYAAGNIVLNGNVSIVGQLYTNSSVVINGGGNAQRNILGGIVSASSDITLNGGIRIQYAQLSTTGLLEEFFSDIPEGVRLVDWAEF